MDLQEKDAYIAEHLMKLEPDTLRFMVADLTSEVQRLTQLCKEQGRKLVAEKVFSETSEVGVEFAEDAVARTQKELESERAERLHWFKRVKENESALTLHAEEKALMVAQMAGLDVELSQAREELERLKNRNIGLTRRIAYLEDYMINKSGQATVDMVEAAAGRRVSEYSTALTAAEQREKGLKAALEKIAESYKPFNMSIISLMGKIAYDALEKAALAAASEVGDGSAA